MAPDDRPTGLDRFGFNCPQHIDWSCEGVAAVACGASCEREDVFAVAVHPDERIGAEAAGDDFNILNHQNITQLDQAFGSDLQSAPDFARPINASIARRIQFSLDYEF